MIVEGIHLDPELFLRVCGQNALNPLPGFNSEGFGTELKGKQGFVLPILVTRPDTDLQTLVRHRVFASREKQRLDVPVAAIADYAIRLQERLKRKFPPAFQIDITGADAVNLIHTVFLEQLDSYYRGLQR
jgi:hypothetical protein